MNNFKLNNIINKYLNTKNIKDNSINGMQIEGKKNIKNILTCVSINNFIIDKALFYKIDTIISHHGILWHNDIPNIIGIKKKRIYKILINNINIFSWHLPLDIHPKIGNNIIIANKLDIKTIKLPNNNFPVLIGKINTKKKINQLIKKNKNIYFLKSKKKKIKKIGICSGLGEKYLEKTILNYNIDTYITGEILENSFYIIKEYDINIIIMKHHISEIYGIKKLGEWIEKNFYIKVFFLDTFNIYENLFYKKELNK